ncbi:hypothetical protein CYK37_30160 [Mesorhizobium loti]|nr:hypothetical protein CYK37_30160 [Mesorhizobium loti]
MDRRGHGGIWRVLVIRSLAQIFLLNIPEVPLQYPPEMPLRYIKSQDKETGRWAIVDAFTGKPLVLNGAPLVGLDIVDAVKASEIIEKLGDRITDQGLDS